MESVSSLLHQTTRRRSRRPLMRRPRQYSWRASQTLSITSVRSARWRRYAKKKNTFHDVKSVIDGIVQVAHEHKIPLIVDNTFGMGGRDISFPATKRSRETVVRLFDPPDRARCRHRRAQRNQMDRRTRHYHRRRHSRCRSVRYPLNKPHSGDLKRFYSRNVRLDIRSLPLLHFTFRGLPRAQIRREIWQSRFCG